MGGWKNLRIIGWVRHNGEVDLKMTGGGGGGLIHSKVILVPQNFHPLTQCPKNTQQVKCIPQLAQDTFSFTFPCL